jgi:uncharacterized protein (UPF0264 family)
VLPAAAAAAGADGCMIDTAEKRGSTLFSELSADELAEFVARCRAAGLLCALAGSLREEHVPQLAELGPDIIGFRGAVCRGDRVGGRVDADSVRRLKALTA